MKFSAVILGALAGLAVATKPDTSKPPKGNPIYSPSKHASVHAGSQFEITWEPTTKGSVTLNLLHGANTNTLESIQTLGDKIANTGRYAWTPAEKLSNSGIYGIEIVSDEDASYQYSNPFFVVGGGSSAAKAHAAAASGTAALKKGGADVTVLHTKTRVVCPATASAAASGSKPAGVEPTTAAPYGVAPTGTAPAGTAPLGTATGSRTGPKPTAPAGPPPNAAGRVGAGSGVAAVAAVVGVLMM